MTPRRPVLADLAGPALIAVVVALAVPGLWRSAGAPMEEGFMLVFPEQLLDGRLPHRDFLHLYGPGSLWVLAAAFRLFGTSIDTERVIGLLQHLLVCFGVYALVRPAGRRLATVAGLTSALIVLTPLGFTALAWDGALGLAVVGLALGVRAVPPPGVGADPAAEAAAVGAGVAVPGVAVQEAAPRRLPVASGVLCAAALLYRPDMAVALGAAMVLLLRRLPVPARRRFAFGFVPAAATIGVHLVTSGIGESITGMVIEPLFELRPGRHLPIPPSWSTVDGYLQRTAALDIPDDWSLQWFGLSQQIFLWFVVALGVTVGLLLGARRLRRRDGVAPTPAADALVVGGVWSALLVTQALQRPDSAHLAWVTAVSLPIALAMAGHLLGRRVGTARAGWIALVAAAGFLVGVVPFFPLRAYGEAVAVGFGDGRPGTEIVRGDRMFRFGSPEGAASAQRVVDRLDRLARPGDRLIVGTVDLSRTVYSDAYLYHLFGDLEVGTRYIEMDPGIADADDSELAAELERNDWLILSTLWDGWNEPNESTDSRSQAANRVVRRDYCEELDAGAYRLLRKCR